MKVSFSSATLMHIALVALVVIGTISNRRHIVGFLRGQVEVPAWKTALYSVTFLACAGFLHAIRPEHKAPPVYFGLMAAFFAVATGITCWRQRNQRSRETTRSDSN